MEKPILQAYSAYRIMLTQLILNQPEQAKVTYKKLIADYPDGKDGHVIVEMTNAFWQEYQVSYNTGNACAKAVDFAASTDKPFINYIGSGHQGWQMKTYKPEDICPFK